MDPSPMSAAPAKTADPSMEEILASIRRIIADDDDRAPEPRPEPSASASKSEDAQRVPHEPVRAAVEAPAEEHEDILDLASIPDRHANDTSLEIDLPDLSFQSVPEPVEASVAPAMSAPERPDVTSEFAEPASAEPAPVAPAPAEPAPAEPPATLSAPIPPVAAPAFRPIEPARPAEMHRPSPEPVREDPPPQPRPATPPADAILSQATTASVGQAFNLLSHTIMSQNQNTLEDLVREMLKPMLKTWLDDNLPPLVERLVTAEIQRVARGQR